MNRQMISIFRYLGELLNFIMKKADPIMLIFLLLVTNYRFSLKIIAIVAIYLYRPNFSFRRTGIFWFYLGILLLGVFNLLFVSRDLSVAHVSVVFAASLLWAGCLLVFHQLDLFVTRNPIEKTVNTLKALTVINFVFSFVDLLRVMLATHTVNPYTQIAPPPYGISSGDLIGGVFGEMHLVNMSISAFLMFFFIVRRELPYGLYALIPLLLTGSNLGTLVSVSGLAAMLVCHRPLEVKYHVLILMAIVVLFYAKITPDNLRYFEKTFTKLYQRTGGNEVVVEPASELPEKQKTEEDIKNEKISAYLRFRHRNIATNSTDSVYFLKMELLKGEVMERIYRDNYSHYRRDSLYLAKNRDHKFDFGQLKKFDFNKSSGKVISFQQVGNYLRSSPSRMLFGSGPGGFSSRLAFISSGIVSDSRILMTLPHYENEAFVQNHKAIFRYLQYLDDEYHSITNLPFSWYAELLGEYGVVGAMLFVFFYLGFFVLRFRRLVVGKYLLFMLLLFFLFDYWFQRISVMVLFELIMLLDLKLSNSDDAREKS